MIICDYPRTDIRHAKVQNRRSRCPHCHSRMSPSSSFPHASAGIQVALIPGPRQGLSPQLRVEHVGVTIGGPFRHSLRCSTSRTRSSNIFGLCSLPAVLEPFSACNRIAPQVEFRRSYSGFCHLSLCQPVFAMAILSLSSSEDGQVSGAVFCGYPISIVFNPISLSNLIWIVWKYQLLEIFTNNQARMENTEIFHLKQLLPSASRQATPS